MSGGFLSKYINVASPSSVEDYREFIRMVVVELCNKTGWSVDAKFIVDGIINPSYEDSYYYVICNHLAGSSLKVLFKADEEEFYLSYLPPCTSSTLEDNAEALERLIDVSLSDPFYFIVDQGGHGVWIYQEDNVFCILGEFINSLSYPYKYTSSLDKICFYQDHLTASENEDGWFLFKQGQWNNADIFFINTLYLNAASSYMPQGDNNAVLTPLELGYDSKPYGVLSGKLICYATTKETLTAGKVLDEGNYIYYNNNLVLGWDSSNSVEDNPWSNP